MKILIVSQYYYPEPFAITKIAEYLVKQGHNVTVLTSQPNYGYYRIMPGYENIKYEEINGVKVHRIKVVPRQESKLSIIRNYLSFYFHAKKFIHKLDKDFDIVYSMSLSPIISIAPAIKYAKKYKIKHILHNLDLWPESVVATGMVKKNSLFYKILLMWSRKMYLNTDEILVSSPSFIDYLKNVIGVDASKCKVIYQPNLNDKTKNIDGFLYDNRYLNILYCGNLGIMQEIPLLVEGMKKIKQQNIPVRMYVIGLGSMKNYLVKKINEENLEDSIIYLGAKPASESSQYITNIDALYLALHGGTVVSNTIPNKLNFYMSFAKPILAMIEGDGRDLLSEAQGAILMQNNVDSFVEGIVNLTKLSKHQKEVMGNRNLHYYKEHLENKVLFQQIEAELINYKNK